MSVNHPNSQPSPEIPPKPDYAPPVPQVPARNGLLGTMNRPWAAAAAGVIVVLGTVAAVLAVSTDGPKTKESAAARPAPASDTPPRTAADEAAEARRVVSGKLDAAAARMGVKLSDSDDVPSFQRLCTSVTTALADGTPEQALAENLKMNHGTSVGVRAAVEVLCPELAGFSDHLAQREQTPRGKFDKLAWTEGWTLSSWVVDGSSGSGSNVPSEQVTEVCTKLNDAKGIGDRSGEPQAPGQWLADKLDSAKSQYNWPEALRAGIPALCDDTAKKFLQQAEDGTYDRWFGDGTYVVGKGAGQIPPGTYRARADRLDGGPITNGYWERTAKDGNIIDNNFVTSAQEVTVTVRQSDGQFTSRGMGIWKPVR